MLHLIVLLIMRLHIMLHLTMLSHIMLHLTVLQQRIKATDITGTNFSSAELQHPVGKGRSCRSRE
jgi:hypothetical protein